MNETVNVIVVDAIAGNRKKQFRNMKVWTHDDGVVDAGCCLYGFHKLGEDILSVFRIVVALVLQEGTDCGYNPGLITLELFAGNRVAVSRLSELSTDNMRVFRRTFGRRE